MPGEKTYRANGKSYTLPDSEVAGFLKTYPDAVEAEKYIVGEKSYTIPLNERDGFLKTYPTAQPLKKKEPTTSVPPQPGLGAGGGEAPSTDAVNNKNVRTSVYDGPTGDITNFEINAQENYKNQGKSFLWSTAPGQERLNYTEQDNAKMSITNPIEVGSTGVAQDKTEELLKIKQQNLKNTALKNEATKYLSNIPGLSTLTPKKLEALKSQMLTLGIPENVVEDVYKVVVDKQQQKLGADLVEEKRKEIKKGVGDYDILRVPGTTQRPLGISPDKLTPEAIDQRLIGDANNYMIETFPEREELFSVSNQIRELSSLENPSLATLGKLNELTRQWEGLTKSKPLFDPVSGEYVEKENEETKKYEGEVEVLKQEYADTPREQLGELMLRTKELFQKYDTDFLTPKYYTPEQLLSLGLSNTGEGKWLSLKQIDKIYSTKGIADNRMYPSEAENELKTLAEVTKNNYVSARKKFDAISQAYSLNIDPASGNVGLMGNFNTGLVQALENSPILGSVTKLFTGDTPVPTDLERLEIYVNEAQKNAIPITEKQKKEAETTLGEDVVRAIGGSGVAAVDLAAITILTRGAGLGTGVKLLSDAVTNKYGKIIGGGANILLNGMLTGAEFEAANIGASAGIGEGAAQTIMDKMGVLDKISGKYGVLFKTAVKIGGGAVGETFGEYAGEFTKALSENGFDYDKVIDDTFGKDIDEAIRKGLTTLLVSLTFSGASNTAALVAGKEWLQDKNIPNKEELVKQIDTKLAESEVKPEGTTEAPVTEETMVTEVPPVQDVAPAPVEETVVEKVTEVPAGPIKVGKFEYKKGADGFTLVNTETGNVADPKTIKKHKDKIIDLAAPQWESGKTVERDANGEAYVNDVVNNSENPFQISEAYIMSEELPFELDYKKENIADVLDGAVIDTESFASFSDRNLLGDMKGYTFADNAGTTGQLDILADEASEISGMDIPPQDLVDFMRENKSVKEFREGSKNPYSRQLQQKFKQITGMPLNAETAMKMQQKQAEMLGIKESELEALYNQSQAEDYESTQREFEQYLEANPEAAERLFGPQTEVDVADVEGDGGIEEDISGKTISELGGSWADKNIRNLKVDTKGTLGMNIAPVIWNGAIEAIALSFEGGAKIVDAMAEGVKYLRTELKKQGFAEEKINEMEAEFLELANPLTRRPRKKDSDEMNYLKKEFRARLKAFKRGFRKGGFADGVKQGKKDLKADLLVFQEGIKEAMEPLKSKLKPSQIKALTNRAAKVSTERQLELFQEYADKVISDAAYADNLEAVGKSIKQLKRKLKGRFSDKIKDIGKLNLNDLTVEEVAELKQVLNLANQKVPDTSLLSEYIIPAYGKKTKKAKTPEEFAEAFKKATALDFGDISEIRKASRALNLLKKDLFSMYSQDLLLEEEYLMELARIDETQEWLSSMFKEEAEMIKKGELPIIKENLNKWNKENFTPQENNLIQDIKNLTDDEIIALTFMEVEALSDISERIAEGMIPVFEAQGIYNRAIGKSNGKKVAAQINEALAKNTVPELEKVQKKLRRIESQKVEDVLNVGRGDSIYKYLYNVLARGITRMRKSNDELSKKYADAVKGSVTERITPFSKKKEILSTTKVGILRRLASVRSTEGTAGGWEISSFDYFGLLLGEEQAYNNLVPAEGNTDVEGGKKKLRDHMTEQAQFYALEPNGKIDGVNQLDIMREVYKTLPRKADGSIDIDKATLTAREQRIAEAVEEIEEEQRNKQRFANESKGLPFTEQAFYLPTIGIGKPPKDIEINESAMNPKLRAGASYEKKDFYPKAISINLGEMIAKSINETNKDYYVNEVLGQVNPTLAYANAGLNSPSIIVKKILTDDIAARVTFNMKSAGMSKVLSNLLGVSYARALVNPISRLTDIITSFLKVPLYTGTAKGIGVTFSKEDRKLFKKLINDTDSSLGLKISRMADPNVIGERGGQTIYQEVVDRVMSVDEAVNLAGAWLPRFQSEYFNLTGMEFDSDAYLNEPSYYENNKRAIDEAAGSADKETKKLYGTGTKFEQRQNIQLPLFDVKANTVGGVMAAHMNTFSNREQGEMFDNVWQVYKGVNKDRDVAARQALSLFLSSAAYGWLRAALAAIVVVKLTGDDEEKKKAEKALSNLTSPKGVLSEMGATLGYLATSKYAAAGRYITLVSLSGVHEMTTDKELKEQIKDFTKSNLYTSPIKFTPEGAAFSMLQLVPPISVAVNDAIGVMKGGRGWKNEPGGAIKLWEKLQKEGFEGLTKDEQDRWALIVLVYNSLSMVGAWYGYTVPMKSTIDKAIRGQVKESKKPATPQKRVRVL